MKTVCKVNKEVREKWAENQSHSGPGLHPLCGRVELQLEEQNSKNIQKNGAAL